MKRPPTGGGRLDEFPAEEFTDDATASAALPLLGMGHRAALKYERAQRCAEARVDNQLDAWRDAAMLLADLGIPPMAPLAVSRALWRRGDRTLALKLARQHGAMT